MTSAILRFDDAGNYRGSLEAKEEDGQCYWRVDCDVSEEDWQPIPRSLFEELKKHHDKHDAKAKALREEWNKPGGLMDGPFA